MNAQNMLAVKSGDWVRVSHTMTGPYRVVELRGPLGPGGVEVYRVRLRHTPRPAYMEITADQIEAVVPPPRKKSHTDAPAS